MTQRTSRWTSRALLCGALFVMAGLAGPTARADGIYSITDLGTLSGQSSSVATSINNQGQVVGISYNSSDGYFTQVLTGSALPPRFFQTGSGAESFLYSNGQMAQINPTGGLATSINDSGQVVGGQNSSINDAGQYVGGPNAGIQIENPGTTSWLVSGSATTTLPSLFLPYSINNSGETAGYLLVNAHGGDDSHPAIYQNGQVTDLFSKVASGQYYESAAVAINAKGDLLITVQPMGGAEQSYLYHANTGLVTNLTALPGGSGMIAAALNSSDQAVGNGFLFANGAIQTLAGLLPSSSGWSNLNATGINDAGQIVGQGTYDGQQVAFLMTPEAVPEPGMLAIWVLVSAYAGSKLIALRSRNQPKASV
jgi:uncharacterized membrane protein